MLYRVDCGSNARDGRAGGPHADAEISVWFIPHTHTHTQRVAADKSTHLVRPPVIWISYNELIRDTHTHPYHDAPINNVGYAAAERHTISRWKTPNRYWRWKANPGLHQGKDSLEVAPTARRGQGSTGQAHSIVV